MIRPEELDETVHVLLVVAAEGPETFTHSLPAHIEVFANLVVRHAQVKSKRREFELVAPDKERDVPCDAISERQFWIHWNDNAVDDGAPDIERPDLSIFRCVKKN